MRHLFFYIFSTILFFTLINCSQNTDPIIPISENYGDIDFGYPYSIVLPSKQNVILLNDTIHINISHSGCSPLVDFEMKYSVRNGTHIVWLKNNDPGSDCLTVLKYWVKYRIPKELTMGRHFFVFLGPDNIVESFIN